MGLDVQEEGVTFFIEISSELLLKYTVKIGKHTLPHLGLMATAGYCFGIGSVVVTATHHV